MNPALSGLLLAALLLQNCELSDYPFHSGYGKISGRVEINGTPVEGAQVTRTGAPFNTHPILTSSEGKFTMSGVPAGNQEIIIRAANQKKALRTHATVVSDHTSNLSAITLEDAIDLKITVMDPDLPIKDAKVRLQEIPTLEAPTNLDGTTVLPCIPPTGAYTATVTYFPFIFLPATVPEDGRWDRGILLKPDAAEYQTTAKVHHAYLILHLLHQKLGNCSADCHVPDWWSAQGPPCPMPIGEVNEQNIDLEDTLRDLANELAQLERFAGGRWSTISCPQWDQLTVECREHICIPSLPDEIIDAVKLASGHESMGCFKGNNLLVADKGSVLNSILSCLDAENIADAGPYELYILYQIAFEIDSPHLATAIMNDTACLLFFEGDLYPTLEQSQVPAGDWPWVLYKLRFSAGHVPTPDQVEAHVSWINPVQ